MNEIQPRGDSSAASRNGAIYDATLHCFQQLSSYIDVETAKNSVIAASLKQRLEVWAKYSGAMARPGLSLDDRLRDYQDIESAILGLLNLIRLQLDQGLLNRYLTSLVLGSWFLQ